MPRYNYIALDARGQESSGVLDAESQNDAIAQLRQAGYFPKSLTEEGKGPKGKAKGPAVAGGGGTSAGVGDEVSRRASESACQPGQERGVVATCIFQLAFQRGDRSRFLLFERGFRS